MEINSLIKEIKEIKIENISIDKEVYMFPFQLENDLPNILPFKNTLSNMLKYCPIKYGVAYLTIDQKDLKIGQTHRRGKRHTDGNYIFGWGGGGWLCGMPGRMLNTEQHSLQYENQNGGFLMLSSYSACQAWPGKFEGKIGQGGDCSDISVNDGFLLKPHTLYIGNSMCIHESIPVKENIKRTLIRITLPASEKLNIC